MKFPRLRVRYTDNWIEVYAERLGSYKYSYMLGLKSVDGSFIVTDAWIDPKLRNKGLGKRMVEHLRRASGCTLVYAHGVLPEAKGFWESVGVPEVEETGKADRISRKRSRFLAGEWFYD